MRDEQVRDRSWLEGLFDAHHRQLLAFAVRRVGHDRAEDVVSEVFFVAWRRRSEVPVPPAAWLYRVARNIVGHEYRSRDRRARLRTVLGLQRSAQGNEFDRVDIDAVLDQLPVADAEILRLTIWEQLTPSEIAEVLAISPGAACQRLMRARATAQRIHALTEQDEPEPARRRPLADPLT